MENEPFNPIENNGEHASSMTSPEISQQPKVSFIPENLLEKHEEKEGVIKHGLREKCATIGVIIGVVAVISWIVIIFGVLLSIGGIFLSIAGLKSSKRNWARIGLALSIIGLILSLWYIFAAYNGMINYNYFTEEFWG